MDFSRLPDNVFLQIFEYLPMEDCARLGCVNKSFHRISQSTISRTKCLDLTNDRFRKLSAYQLAVILDLCSPNLKKIAYPIDYQTGIPSSLLATQMATTLANYECNRLTDLILGSTPINYDVFQQLIRHNSNLESLNWHAPSVGFPMVTSNNLKKLYLRNVNDFTLQSMIGQIPNLKELYLMTTYVTADVFEELFASTQQIQCVKLCFSFDYDQIVFDDSLVNFWNLPLTSLAIKLDGEVDLQKVATSFPHLQTLWMRVSNATSDGVSALAALQELKFLHLNLPNGPDYIDNEIGALVACKQLRYLKLTSSTITASTLIGLLGGCPQLEYILVHYIDDVDSSIEAAVVLESLSGIAKRDITIRFDPTDNYLEEWLQSIWDKEAVVAAIKNLDQNEGIKILIDWLCRENMPSDVDEMMDDGV